MARLGPQPRCPPRLPDIDLLHRSAAAEFICSWFIERRGMRFSRSPTLVRTRPQANRSGFSALQRPAGGGPCDLERVWAHRRMDMWRGSCARQSPYQPPPPRVPAARHNRGCPSANAAPASQNARSHPRRAPAAPLRNWDDLPPCPVRRPCAAASRASGLPSTPASSALSSPTTSSRR